MWRLACNEECKFWKEWFEQKGGRWANDYRTRTSGSPPFPDIIKKYALLVGLNNKHTIKVLDIGAGPISFIGTKSDAFQNIEVVAIDPLADFYDQLLKDHHIVPHVKTTTGQLETLGTTFGEEFDIVWSCNSLDHSYDPLMGIFGILSVLKTGGLAFIVFHPREATYGSFQGLHQWDLYVDGRNHFMLERRSLKLDLSKLLESTCKLFIEVHGTGPKSRCTVAINKVKSTNVTEMIHHLVAAADHE